jgi:hypothetical protein
MASPLHAHRFEIEKDIIQNGRIKTGDILFRQGNERYLGLPFSSIVARITDSKYSHASIALVENDEVYLVEVALNGTEKYRLIDWLDYSAIDTFEVWRCTYQPSLYTDEKLRRSILDFLQKDPEYDLTFSNSDQRFYCTESIVYIFQNAGMPKLCTGVTAKSLLPWWKYNLLFRPLNYIFGMMLGASIPPLTPLVCVGNHKIGLMSSPFLEQVYRYTAPKG